MLRATVLFALLAAPAFADTARIIDADSLQIGDEVFRINGIDAPERGQKCADADGGVWNCGLEAKKALEELLADGVECEKHEVDQYGRWVATCYSADGTDVGRELVVQSLAWAFRRYSDVYAAEEDAAREAGLGIWQAETQPPWDYRAEKWGRALERAPADAPEGCPIKGNAGGLELIYHAPWSPWYERTKMGNDARDKWFCDEGEALQAGFRPPKW